MPWHEDVLPAPSHDNAALSKGMSLLVQPPDDIVDTMIGFGRWQLIVTFLLSFVIFAHMLNTGTEGLMGPDGWWCKKPKFLANWTTLQWILYSHNSDSCVGICNRHMWDEQLIADGYFQGCAVYNINYTKLNGTKYSERPRITTKTTIPCPFGIFYSTMAGKNLAEKFNRSCDNGTALSNLWKSSDAFGRIFGYLIWGNLSDRIGRKPVFFIACGITSITSFLVASSTRWIFFIITSIINGFFEGGYSVSPVLIMETATNNQRSKLLAIGCCMFALGIGLTPIATKFLASYDLMLVATSSLTLLAFIFYRYIPESPAWLFCCRKVDKLESIVKTATRINQTQISPNFRITYIEFENERLELPKKRPQLWNILTEAEILYEIIGIAYLTALCGLIFGSSSYSILAKVTNSYLADSLLAASTIGGMISSQACLLLMGHRKTLQISLVLVFISCFMLTIDLHDFKPTNQGPIITFLLINISLVSLCYGVLLNYNVRTVPTLVRGSMCGIFRAIWALFVWTGNHDYVQFPTIAFTLIMSYIPAALFSLNLKDLYQRELPDTVLDSRYFRIKSKPRRWNIEEIDANTRDNRYQSRRISWHLMQQFWNKNSIRPSQQAS